MKKKGATQIRMYSSLAKRAKSAMQEAYAPYSNFRVGAALLTPAGEIFTGCNIENSSFSLTLCAERTALFKAISEGCRSFTALAIASDAKAFIMPCGACRQVLTELAEGIDVIITDSRSNMRVVRLKDLLPQPFRGESILRKK